MTSFAERVQIVADIVGSQSELARRVTALSGRHTAPGTINNLCKRGPKEAKSSSLSSYIAEAGGVRLEWLISGSEPMRPDVENTEPTIYPAFKYPIVSWVSAGMWQEAIDLYAPGVAEDLIFSTYKGGPHTFALRVQGDSMANPTGAVSFPEGIIIVVDPDIIAENGSYVVARLNGSMEATFKQLVIDGSLRFLKPLNPRYPLIPITEECQICGVVKAAEMRF